MRGIFFNLGKAFFVLLGVVTILVVTGFLFVWVYFQQIPSRMIISAFPRYPGVNYSKISVGTGFDSPWGATTSFQTKETGEVIMAYFRDKANGANWREESFNVNRNRNGEIVSYTLRLSKFFGPFKKEVNIFYNVPGWGNRASWVFISSR